MWHYSQSLLYAKLKVKIWSTRFLPNENVKFTSLTSKRQKGSFTYFRKTTEAIYFFIQSVIKKILLYSLMKIDEREKREKE